MVIPYDRYTNHYPSAFAAKLHTLSSINHNLFLFAIPKRKEKDETTGEETRENERENDRNTVNKCINKPGGGERGGRGEGEAHWLHNVPLPLPLTHTP